MSSASQKISDVSRFFARKHAELRKNEDEIGDIAAAPLLDAWATGLDWATSAKLDDKQLDRLSLTAEGVSNAYEVYTILDGEPQRDALRNLAGSLYEFEKLFAEVERLGVADRDIPILRRKIDRAKDASELALSVMFYVSKRFETLEEAVRTTKDAAVRAEGAVALAEQAATKSSTSALEKSFATTATNNNKVAWTFRLLTIAVLGAVVALGYIYSLDHRPGEDGSVDWYGIAYRVAILSGLGALAAYLGRQAGNYTRLATWAHGIQIQLKAFLGFVNEIEDGEARQTMFTLFGKRVLESPPDGKSSTDDGPTNVIQPIFEQAAKIRPPQ